MTSELINEYIDEAAIKKQTDVFLGELDKVLKAFNEIGTAAKTLQTANSGKDISAAATQATNSIKQLNDTVNNAIGAQTKLVETQKKVTSSSNDAAGAFDKLKSSYKQALTSLKDVSAEFGVDSKEAADAAKNVALLHEQITAINKIPKSKKPVADVPAAPSAIPSTAIPDASIPFTNNLDDLKKEQQELQKTGEAVSEFNRQEADAANAATAWAGANKLVGDSLKQNNASTAAAQLSEEEVAYNESIRTLVNYKIQLEDVKNKQKDLKSSFDNQVISTEEYAAAQTNLIKQEKELSASISLVNKEISNRNKADFAVPGSIDAARAQNSILTQKRNSLDTSNPEEAAQIKEINALLDRNNQIIKENADAYLKQKINIGNYVGALATLEATQAEAVAQLERLNQEENADAATKAKLQQEISLLNVLISQQAKGFSSLTVEIRNGERALQTMRAAGLEGTQGFKELQEQVVSARREFVEFQRQEKLLGSEAPVLAALTSAARGLGAAYAVGAGATALFGDNNEKVEKELNKLVAIMTVLQGLTEFNRFLQERTAIATALLSAKTTALNAVDILRRFVLTGSFTAQQQATTAQEANVAVTETQVATTEANVVATTEQTVATEAMTAATRTSSAAMITLRGALIATGIGAILILITSTVAAMSNLGKSTRELTKEDEKLSEAIKQLNDAYISQVETIAKADQGYKTFLQNQLSLSQANGDNQYKQIALRKQLAEEDKKLAQQQVDGLGSTNKRQADLLSDIEKAQNKAVFFQQQYQKALEVPANKQDSRLVNAAKLLADNAQKEVDQVKSIYEAGEKARQDLFTANQAGAQLDYEQSKLSADERRKLILTETELEVDLTKTKNEFILNSEKTTQRDRISSINAIAEAQKKLIEAQKNDVLNNNSSTDTDKLLAIKKAAEEEKKLTLQTSQDILKVNEDYANRRATDEHDINQRQLAQIASFQDSVQNEELLGLQKRLDAHTAYIQSEEAIIDRDYAFQKKQLDEKGGINEDYQRLEAEKNNKLVQLSVNAQNKLYSILKSEADKEKKLQEDTIKSIQSFYQSMDVQAAQAYAVDVDNLTKSLTTKKISYQQYIDKLTELDNNYAQHSGKNQLSSLKDQLSQYKDLANEEIAIQASISTAQTNLDNAGTETEKTKTANKLKGLKDELAAIKDNNDKRAALAKQIADLEAKLDKEGVKSTEDTIAKKREKITALLHAIKDTADAVAEAIKSAVEGAFQRQINNIELLKTKVDAEKDAELAANDATAQSAADKANNITLINARAAAKKDALDRQERETEYKKAKAEKAFSIAQVIMNTALAVTDVLRSGGGAHYLDFGVSAGILSAFVTATGAAQLAAILAQPITPAYKTGKNVGEFDKYSGKAWVGDGGKKELIIRENGKVEVTPSVPTLTYVNSNDIILPDADRALSTIQKTTENNNTEKSITYNRAIVNTISVDRYREILNNAAIATTLRMAGSSVTQKDFDKAYMQALQSNLESKLEKTNQHLMRVERAIINKPVARVTNTMSGLVYSQEEITGHVDWVNKYFKS